MLLKRPIIVISSLVLLVLVAVVSLEASGVTHFFHQPKSSVGTSDAANSKNKVATPVTTAPTTPGTIDKTQSGTSTPVSAPDSEKRSPATSTALLAPTGTFASAHKSVPINATLSSVCNTTSGAQCRITFTMGGVTKSLDAQTADRVGAVYWNSWTPESIGLTAGQWQITAVATLNGQTATSTDSLALEIRT